MKGLLGTLFGWFSVQKPQAAPRPRLTRPSLETLEDRLTPTHATFSATSVIPVTPTHATLTASTLIPGPVPVGQNFILHEVAHLIGPGNQDVKLTITQESASIFGGTISVRGFITDPFDGRAVPVSGSLDQLAKGLSHLTLAGSMSFPGYVPTPRLGIDGKLQPPLPPREPATVIDSTRFDGLVFGTGGAISVILGDLRFWGTGPTAEGSYLWTNGG